MDGPREARGFSGQTINRIAAIYPAFDAACAAGLDEIRGSAGGPDWVPFHSEEVRFAMDSPLEGDGFELLVPVRQAKLTRSCR
jgi:hypothetical protein